MKKILLSIIISGTSVCLFAQTPTMDFETWTGTGNAIEPAGWISENAVTGLPGNPQSVFQAGTPDNHAGTYSLKVTSVTMAFNPSASTLPNPIGLAATGTFTGTTLNFGYPFAGRPATADFWYKYTPAAGGDTAAFFAVLWNGTSGDTVAFAIWKTGATVGTYTQQSVTFQYDPTFASVVPDSMAITFTSTRLFNPDYSFCLNCGKAGSTLFVDDLGFYGWSGVNEHPSSNGVTLYPNPASDLVTISSDASDAVSAMIYDVTGRVVATSSDFSEVTNGKKWSVNTSALTSGIYSYSLVDNNGAALRSGKFNVAR